MSAIKSSSGMKQKEIPIFQEEFLQKISTNSSSKGNQEKWYHSEQDIFIKAAFYYEQQYWNDYLVEIIASQLAQQLHLCNVSVIKQKPCIIQKGKEQVNGVFSKNFRKNEKQVYIPLYRLLKLHGKEDSIIGFPGKRFEIIRDSLLEYTKLDVTDYLIVMVILDFLVGNEDRHLNNLGVILENDTFYQAPLFDFGLGMFEHSLAYKNKSLQQAIDLMESKPFCANQLGIINWLKNNYKETVKNILPDVFKITDFIFPSELAKEYFYWACNELEVEIDDTPR